MRFHLLPAGGGINTCADKSDSACYTCPSGAYCARSNSYYWQCIPIPNGQTYGAHLSFARLQAVNLSQIRL